MLDVEVRNFQSIEQVSIRIEGFTALVGKSNIGKSALVRAIKYALTNELGTDFVRHERSTCARMQKGAKTCKCFASVHLRQDGFDLLWEKGDSKNCYTFNGTRYDKPGQGMPDFLANAGLAPVKIGGEPLTLQVADQFYPIFLLDQTGPAAAESIADVARLDKISLAMKNVDKDRRENQATLKVREKDVAALKVKLSQYDGLEMACAKASAVETGLQTIERCARRAEELSAFIDSTQTLVEDVKALAEVVRVKCPDLLCLMGRWKTVQEATAFHAQLTEKAAEFRRLSGAEKIAEPPPIEPLSDKLECARQLGVWLGRMRAFRKVFDDLSIADRASIPSIDSLVDLHSRTHALSKYHSKLVAMKSTIQGLQQEMRDVEAEEAELDRQREELGGVCPTCSQPIAEHSHA